MTPDVNSVLDLVNAYALAYTDPENEYPKLHLKLDDAKQRIQQAAEQACYRYALAVLEHVEAQAKSGMGHDVALWYEQDAVRHAMAEGA